MITMSMLRAELGQTFAPQARPRRFLAGLKAWQTRRAAQVIQVHADLLAAPDEAMDFGAGSHASAVPQPRREDIALKE